MPRARCAVLLAGLGLLSATAHANGRFPRADQLAFVPGQPDRLWLRATFGLVASSDAGRSWDWVCERAIGFSGQQDPALGILEGGVVVAGLFEGLAQSDDQGCSWFFAETQLPGTPIVDFTVRPGMPAAALALAWEAQPATASTPGYRSRFLATDDGGRSWRPYGAGIDPAVLVLTLDVAPTDPERLYASGIRAGASRTAALYVSTDRAATWTERPVPFETGSEQGLYIAAVDPNDADLVYLRTSSATRSRLLVTRDAGQSFQEPYAGGPMLGFALAPDGSRVYLGGLEDGLWTAESRALVFEQRSSLPVQCLAASADTLYACSSTMGGFALGASRDDGTSFTPLLQLDAVRGPLACAPQTSVAQCAAEWPDLARRLGVAEMVASPDAGAEPAPGEGSGACATSDAPAASSRARRSLPAVVALAGLVLMRSCRRRRG
jgi:hypothetical protein